MGVQCVSYEKITMNQSVKLAIRQLEPISKAAQLRQWMPEIEEKLAAGVKLVAIHQTLVAIGFDLPFQTLKKYLYRYRRKERAAIPADNAVKRESASKDKFQKNHPAEFKVHLSAESNLRPSLSIQEIGRLMHPDPVQQAEKLARYERVARQQRRSQT